MSWACCHLTLQAWPRPAILVKVAFAILPLIVFLQTLVMPSEIYGGDSAAIRLQSIHLARWGEFGIPITLKSSLNPVVLQIPGQYFIENESRGRFFSRWGEMNTLLFAIPEWLRNPSGYDADTEMLLFGNAFNIFLTALIALYFVLISRRMGAPAWAAALVISNVFYATFVATYLRAHAYEIFQLLFFTAFYFHFTTYLARRSKMHLALALSATAALIHIKVFYVILIVPTLFTLARDPKRRILPGRRPQWRFSFC